LVYDILLFEKYGLYALLRFALFKERRSTGEGKASILLLRGNKERCVEASFWAVSFFEFDHYNICA